MAGCTVYEGHGRFVSAGTLHVGVRKVDGEVVSLFEMDVDHVEPLG